jgi:hypothetical protein
MAGRAGLVDETSGTIPLIEALERAIENAERALNDNLLEGA